MMFDCGGIYQEKPYCIQYFGTERRKWTPDILLDIQATVQQRKRERDEAKAAATAGHHPILVTNTVATLINDNGAAAEEATAATTTAPSSGTDDRSKPTMALQPSENTHKLNSFELQRREFYCRLPVVSHAVRDMPATETFGEKRRRLQEYITRTGPDQHGAQNMEQRTPGGGGSRPRWLSQFL